MNTFEPAARCRGRGGFCSVSSAACGAAPPLLATLAHVVACRGCCAAPLNLQLKLSSVSARAHVTPPVATCTLSIRIVPICPVLASCVCDMYVELWRDPVPACGYAHGPSMPCSVSEIKYDCMHLMACVNSLPFRTRRDAFGTPIWATRGNVTADRERSARDPPVVGRSVPARPARNRGPKSGILG